MKNNTWRKHHKWFGLLLAFFIILFCFSGFVLNHPTLFSHINVSRAILPSEYRYHNWNRGLLRGSLLWKQKVLLYGNNGIWLTDSTATAFHNFNRGFPSGTEHRNIRSIVNTDKEQLFAAGQYGLYAYTDSLYWTEIKLPKEQEERLTDLVFHSDTLLLLSRSYLYLGTPPYTQFQKISLGVPDDYDGKVSLFRTIWLLHSGELFGLIGKIIVDLIAFVLFVLAITGVLYWFVPKVWKQSPRLLSKLYAWHNFIGKWTIVCTLFLCITGWLLRPPALIAIASGKIPPLPFSTMDSQNPWHDKLRTLRYDALYNDWLLYTSNGFYTLANLSATPRALKVLQPPVSVMGINVQTQTSNGDWIIGSFSGIFIWERAYGSVRDYFTRQPAVITRGIPIGEHAIVGYSADLAGQPLVVDYNMGTDKLRMPQEMSNLPISLRNVALEVHTGRIFTFLANGTIFFIFFMGIAIAWTIWSGWKRRT